jgi:hypothetical protein
VKFRRARRRTWSGKGWGRSYGALGADLHRIWGGRPCRRVDSTVAASGWRCVPGSGETGAWQRQGATGSAPGEASVGVLDRQTYQGGTRGSRLCGGDRDRETENSKVCARTKDTRFIQVRVAKVANPTSCLGDQVWRPALGVGLSPEGLGMCG